jgi:tetratricopeptide (TPR) repeat protein
LLAFVSASPALAATQTPADSTLAAVEDSARRDSNDAELQYRLALTYWDAKRWNNADSVLHLAVVLDPRSAPAWLALAYLPYARRPDLMKREEDHKHPLPDSLVAIVVESERLRRRAFLLDPLVDLRILGTVFPLSQRMSVRDYRGRSISVANPFTAFVLGDYHVAFNALDPVVVLTHRNVPDFILWYHGLAAAHLELYAVAIADFQALLDRSVRREEGSGMGNVPMRTNDYRYLLALMEERANRPADAVKFFQESVTNDVGLFVAHLQMGKMYETYKEWDQAVAEFQSAMATDPDDPSLGLDLGIIFREAGRLSESERTLREAMAGTPRDPRIPYNLGITAEELGDTTGARAGFRRFLEIAPTRYAIEIADAHQRLVALH